MHLLLLQTLTEFQKGHTNIEQFTKIKNHLQSNACTKRCYTFEKFRTHCNQTYVVRIMHKCQI